MLRSLLPRLQSVGLDGIRSGFSVPVCLTAVALLIMFAWPAGAQQPSAVDLSNPAAIGAGQELFNTTCAGYCHGRDDMQGKAPSLRARSDLSDEHVHDTIANGRHNAGKLMPAWKGQLSDEKIWQITVFIHSLREPAP
jgi:mono/diheme cytochrome c family protein